MNNKFLSLNKFIFEQIKLPDNAVVADLGCRDAGFLVGLQQAFPDEISQAIGVDITDKWFENAKHQKKIKLKIMDCSKRLQFPDNTFDLVFSADMFECVTDKDFLVSEIHRILKPGGVVICVNCDWESVIYNGENKDLISRVVHAYATTKQPWMDDLDSWIGRRMYGIFNRSGLFDSSVSVHSIVETEYKEKTLGYDLSQDIAWLFEENTGAINKEEYDEFINNLKFAQKEGNYIFSKPYYIYKGVKI